MWHGWAAKKVCKFLLKRLVGKFVKGEIDSNKLDVQLGKGTSSLQLNHVVLNVDYINDQLGESPVIVREGLISSISIRIPWNVLASEKFFIELEELELVLFSRTDVPRSSSSDECSTAEPSTSAFDLEQVEDESIHEHDCPSSFGAVNDGVKMIAKMMERLLLGLHVKIKSLIIVFDPSRNSSPSDVGLASCSQSQSVLAFQLKEAEYSTIASGDDPEIAKTQPKAESGILTQTISFSGATVDLYDMTGNDVKPGTLKPIATILCGRSTESQTVGFAGLITLSIPWKSGCIDIPQVDAEICIDPVNLHLQLSTLQRLVNLSQSMKDCKNRDAIPASNVKASPRSAKHEKSSPSLEKSIFLDESTIPNSMFSSCVDSFSDATSFVGNTANSSVIPDSMIISDWVQNANLGESVCEFLECWDGTRSMQVGSANSSIWNLTCSVFGAITAASTLASGLEPVSSQQNVEYSLNVKLAGITVILLLEEENQHLSSDLDLDSKRESYTSSGVDTDFPKSFDTPIAECQKQGAGCLDTVESFLEVNISELHASIQMSTGDLGFKIDLKKLEILEYFSKDRIDNEAVSLFNLDGSTNISVPNISHLQNLVEGLLPEYPVSLASSATDNDSELTNKNQESRTLASENSNSKRFGFYNTLEKFAVIKILSSECGSNNQLSLSCHISNMRDIASVYCCTKFELNLPPFGLWLDFYMVNKIWKLSRQIEPLSEKSSKDRDVRKYGCGSGFKSDSPQDIIQGSIKMPYGRVILCFPEKSGKDINPFFLKDSFLCVNFSLPKNKRYHEEWKRKIEGSDLNGHSFSSLESVILRTGEVNISFISCTKSGSHMNSCQEPNKTSFSVKDILSIKTEYVKNFPIICFRWKENSGTRQDAVETAWEKAKKKWTDGARGRTMDGNSSDFLAIATAGAHEGSNGQVRDDIIKMSSFFVHLSLPCAKINLHNSEHSQLASHLSLFYETIFFEIDTPHSSMKDEMGRTNSSYVNDSCIPKTPQVSFLVDSTVVNISISLSEPLSVKASLEKELPGIWTGFKLEVQNFQCLAVSNFGCKADAKYFWFSHDEGTLYGSLKNMLHQKKSEEYCLIHCKNNALGRGDGKGTNTLARGSAGTTVISFNKPEEQESLTTITIKCGTLIAPGGRLDWLASVVSFFTQPADSDNLSTSNDQKAAADEISYHAYFSFELLDIAVSYEPFGGVSMLSNISSGSLPDRCSSGDAGNEPYAPVACILAASAMNLSTITKSNNECKKYTISLHDIGLLLLDISKRKDTTAAYDSSSLHLQGYTKIAGEAMMKVGIEINCEVGKHWKITSKSNHICIDTCHDSTIALTRLLMQLQQLLAPDYEEYAVLFETREKTRNQAIHSNPKNAAAGKEKGGIFLNESNLGMDSRHHHNMNKRAGLMHDIVENAFTLSKKPTQINPSKDGLRHDIVENEFIRSRKPSQKSCSKDDLVSTCGSNHNIPSKVASAFPGGSSQNSPSKKASVFKGGCSVSMTKEVVERDSRESEKVTTNSPSLTGSDIREASSCVQRKPALEGRIDNRVEQEKLFPIIEDYCFPDLSHRSESSDVKNLLVENSCDSSKLRENEYAEDNSGGWYTETSFRVVENHVSNIEGKRFSSSALRRNSKSKDSLGNDDQSVGEIVIEDYHITWRMNAGLDWPEADGEVPRDQGLRLDVELYGVNFQYEAFPDGGLPASKLSLSIHDIYILDRSKCAPWKKVLLDYHSKAHPRETSAKALKFELEAVRPDPSSPLEEYRLFVKLLPLQINLAQSQLDFFINFFSQNVSSSVDEELSNDNQYSIDISQGGPVEQSGTNEGLLPFFQKCKICPLMVNLNYVPHHLDLASLGGGNYAELVNLVPLKDINLHLNGVDIGGVYGWGSLSEIAIEKWVEDISQNQVHKVLKGIAPIRSLFALGHGVAKLVSIPVEHYKKERRLLNGIQRGMVAFLRSLSLEAVGCGVHLASGAHGVLLHTESALGSLSSSFPVSSKEKLEMSRKANQPGDAHQGLRQACQSITRGLERTATSLITNPIRSYVRGEGAGHAFLTAIQAAPAAAFAPASAAAGAVHRALLGVRNSLDPDHKKESEDKYSGSIPAHNS